MAKLLSQNIAVMDVRPRDIAVIDTKSKDITVVDTKPKDANVFGETVIYKDDRIFQKGQIIPWGGFAITYPTAGTWTGATRI